MTLDDFVPRLVIRVHVRALAWAVAIWSCWASAAASTIATGFDFDEIMMVAMGFAGLAYVIADLKRERRLDRDATEIASRLGSIESAIGAAAPHTIAERVASIESALETFDPVEMRERMAGFEARIDHKPITQTRGKGGKFVAPQSLQDELDALRAELAKRGPS